MQDPLWYPRVGHGDLKSGAATRLRRLRGRIDEGDPRDMVEYHVVRQGVDEQAVCKILREHFASVELIPYWSNQQSIMRRAAEGLGPVDSFSVRSLVRT